MVWKQSLLSGACNVLRVSRLMHVCRKIFGGRGVILMYHQVLDDPAEELMTGSKKSMLDHSLGWLRSNGWEIVSLSDGLRRVGDPTDERRFAIITFDDGYRDILTNALPILERHAAPFLVYLPTGALTRTLYSWWLGLRELFRAHDVVTVDAMSRRFTCSTQASKILGLKEVSQWIHRDLTRAPALRQVFVASDISLADLNDRYFLSEGEVVTLARHPLATIGAHTTSHSALSTLTTANVRSEIGDNRTYLESLVNEPVQHFAYPYGHQRACGPREAKIADELGFQSSVTTRHGHLSHSAMADWRRQLLPRIAVTPHETPATFDGRMSGLVEVMSRALGSIGLQAR